MNEFKEFLTLRARYILCGTTIVGGILANFAGLILRGVAPITLGLAEMECALRIFGNLLLASSTAYVLYILIIIARLRGFTTKRTASIIVVILFCSLMTIMAYTVGSMYVKFTRYITQTQTDVIEEISLKMRSTTTPPKKAKLSYLYSKYKYEDDGSITNYFDEDGTQHLFKPDAEAKRNRDLVLFGNELFRLQSSTMSANCLIWILSTLTSVYIATRKGASAEGRSADE